MYYFLNEIRSFLKIVSLVLSCAFGQKRTWIFLSLSVVQIQILVLLIQQISLLSFAMTQFWQPDNATQLSSCQMSCVFMHPREKSSVHTLNKFTKAAGIGDGETFKPVLLVWEDMVFIFFHCCQLNRFQQPSIGTRRFSELLHSQLAHIIFIHMKFIN